MTHTTQTIPTQHTLLAGFIRQRAGESRRLGGQRAVKPMGVVVVNEDREDPLKVR